MKGQKLRVAQLGFGYWGANVLRNILAVPRAEVELAERKRLTLMVGHTFLYATPVRMLKEYLDRGELGSLRYLYSQRLNLGRVQDDISVLWSVGPHDVSIFLHLLGSLPVEVAARGLSCLRPGIEDVVFLTMLFPDGVTAQTHLSWVDACKVRRVTLVGGRKTAVYDDVSADERIVLYNRAVQLAPGRNGNSAAHAAADDVFVPPCPYPEPLRVECEHFVDCALGGETPATGGAQGLDVVRVLEAAERSMAEGGRPVRLDPDRG